MRDKLRKSPPSKTFTDKDLEKQYGKPWYMNIDVKGSYHNVGMHFMCKPIDCKILMRKEIRSIFK